MSPSFGVRAVGFDVCRLLAVSPPPPLLLLSKSCYASLLVVGIEQQLTKSNSVVADYRVLYLCYE